jgi:FkbM family methyltransferase
MVSYSLSDTCGNPIDLRLDEEVFKKQYNGFFIELGANNGLNQSNTAFLERERGWRGILIEPSPNSYIECVSNRPNSKCYNAACVSNDFSNNYIEGDFNGHLMSSVNGIRSSNTSLINISALTLESILDSYGEIPTIDFLSLDTEGYELPILKGLNLNKYRPRYMLIEIYNWDYDNIIEYLRSHKYECITNFSNYNKVTNPCWDGAHNDYLFKDNAQ